MHLNGKFFEKLIFNAVKAKVIILTLYVKTNETMAINKFQRSRLTFIKNMWIFYVFVLSCVCCVFVRICLCVLCGHLLGKG